MKSYSIKVGLFGIGNEAYWPQFDGLLENLHSYLSVTEKNIGRTGVEVVNAGMIDTPEKAFDAGHFFRKEDVDLIFIHVTTYALSHTVLPVVQRAKVPVIILNLTPEKAIDYKTFNAMNNRTAMTGKWLEFCAACPVPEIANVFNRVGIDFFQITGHLKDESLWQEVDQWVGAAKVVGKLYHNRTGCMGHYYNGMLDIQTDLTSMVAHFGGHYETIEVDELTALRKNIAPNEVDDRVAVLHNKFDIQDDCSQDEIRKAATTSVALDKLIDKHNLGAMAYYYMGEGVPDNMETLSTIIVGNSLLTERGIPIAGEYEIKNVMAMKIMDGFGVGGSFTEYYGVDYNDDVVLMGHDGPGHLKIAEGKTKVKPLTVYHGKVGGGLSVEMSVKNGDVTILSVAESKNGKMKLVYAHAETVPGPILEIGNTNSRYKFSIGARKFVETWNENGPAHHSAVGIGHIGPQLQKLAALLSMEIVQVC